MSTQRRIKRQQVIKRQSYNGPLACYYCGEPLTPQTATLDHKIPVSRGGTNDFDNLALACWLCNQDKDNMTEHEYLEHRYRQAGLREEAS